MRLRLDYAAWADRIEPRIRRAFEKWGYPQEWLQEFIGFLDEPRFTPEEFWVRYTMTALEAKPWLSSLAQAGNPQLGVQTFYEKSPYMLWRNTVHRRHSAWRRVLYTMQGDQGSLMEFGCATAPISSWVVKRRPHWHYHLVDVPSRHREYGLWRLRHRKAYASVADVPTMGIFQRCHVITAVDVFEHLSDPLTTAQQLAGLLYDGGVLHWTFVLNPRRNDLDIATEQQYWNTVNWLDNHLVTVWERGGYHISMRKPVRSRSAWWSE